MPAQPWQGHTWFAVVLAARNIPDPGSVPVRVFDVGLLMGGTDGHLVCRLGLPPFCWAGVIIVIVLLTMRTLKPYIQSRVHKSAQAQVAEQVFPSP